MARRQTRKNWLPGREPVHNRVRQTCYKTSTTFAAAMAPKMRSRGMIPTLRARPNACNRGRLSAPASSLATRKAMSVNMAMSPRDAAIPTAVVIVDTVVVVTVDIILSPAFHDDARFPFTVAQALITCQCPPLVHHLCCLSRSSRAPSYPVTCSYASMNV